MKSLVNRAAWPMLLVVLAACPDSARARPQERASDRATNDPMDVQMSDTQDAQSASTNDSGMNGGMVMK